MAVTPALSAMMCDGMGWFAEADYKRALLVYDEILYLLPKTTVEFRDVTGQRQNLLHTVRFQDASEYRIRSFEPESTTMDLLEAAARVDAADPHFREIINGIPEEDRLYTWRVVNADGELGRGKSIGVEYMDQPLAHALLLNKFLLAADHAKAVPITGKHHIHRMIGAKCQIAKRSLARQFGAELPSSLRHSSASYDAAIQQIVGALVSDKDLDRRSFLDIVKFKAENRTLFERFSLLMRRSIDHIESLPDGPEFRREVADLFNTELWKEKAEVEDQLRSAWHELFSSPKKNFAGSQVFRFGAVAATAGMVLGILPSLEIGSLSLASILAPGAVASTWMLERAFDYFHSHREAFKNGMYYLMRFAE